MSKIVRALFCRPIGDKDISYIMSTIENIWDDGDDTLTSYLYTDFLVTIMELESAIRSRIKSKMGIRTKKRYTQLLTMYREL